MSAVMRQGADNFLARYEGLRGQLPGDSTVRDEAAALFRQAGLPGVRNEAWKYTSLRPMAETPFREPLTSVETETVPEIPNFAGPRLVFIDGRLRQDLCRMPDRRQRHHICRESRFRHPRPAGARSGGRPEHHAGRGRRYPARRCRR